MATVVRAEARITAQNSLKPGLSRAIRDLQAFKRQAEAAGKAQARLDRGERVASMARAAVGTLAAYAGGRQLVEATKRYADLDRQMTRIGITGEASAEEVRTGLADLRGLAIETAQPIDKVKSGLDALTASGVSWRESMQMMAPIARTAQASGAAVEDIANSSLAATRHLGIAVKDLQLAQDMMAQGGQLGQFELKDMARYLPSMAPAAKAVGLAGTQGLARMVAMLQVIRQGTGTAEEAATSAANIFQKIESEQTATNFKKFGVDLRTEMDKARKSGKDLITTLVDLTQKATKGDASKIPQLFTDMEFARGMRALINGYSQIPDLMQKISAGSGTVASNLKRVTSDTQADIDRLAESADRAKTSVGSLAAIMASPMMQAGTDNLQKASTALEKAAKIARDEGLGALVVKSAKGAAGQVLTDISEGRRNVAAAEDDYLLRPLADAASKSKSRLASVDAEIAGLEKRAGEPMVKGRLNQLRAERAGLVGRKPSPATDGQLSAFSRQQLRLLGPAADPADFGGLRDDLREAMREAARGSGFGRTTAAEQWPGMVKGGKPGLPPVRPDSLSGKVEIPVQGFEEAATKAEEIKSSVSAIGPAGTSASGQIASAFGASIDQMIAQVERLQQKLNSLRAPSLSFGGLGGLSVGKSMPEAR